MWTAREEALRAAIDVGLAGHKAAPSARERVALVGLAKMKAKLDAAAKRADEDAERAEAIARRLRRAAVGHRSDAVKVIALAAEVRRSGLPPRLRTYSPPGWCELAS